MAYDLTPRVGDSAHRLLFKIAAATSDVDDPPNPDAPENQLLRRIAAATAAGAGAGVVWGDLTGTLADQTDLQAALDAKAPVSLAAVALTYGASLTPNCNDGLRRKVTMTGDATLNAPTNGTDGMIWNGRFVASGAGRALTLNAAIKVPSEFSGITNPVTIASGATWKVQLEYDSALAAWVLNGWTGGYS